jgi:hypothetical protein
LVGFAIYRYKSFCAAASVFRSKVLTELEGIYPLPINWPKDNAQIDPLLRSKFPKLQSAVEEFKPYLSKRKQRSLTNTWIKYYAANGDDRCQSYYEYMPFSGVEIINGEKISHDNTKTYKENFKKNVGNLLKFAKQK